jgi:hypothetical protein
MRFIYFTFIPSVQRAGRFTNVPRTYIYIHFSITLSKKCISSKGPKYLYDKKYLENEREKAEQGKIEELRIKP